MKKAFHKKLPRLSVEEQRKLTITRVPNERDCYTHGIGSETVDALVEALACRPSPANPGPHEVYIGTDARVLGANLAEVAAALKGLRGVNATVHDLKHNETETEDLLLRARAGFQWNGDKRRQRSKGKLGGKKKGVEAEARRNAAVDDVIAFRLCRLKKLTWAEKAWVLGMPETTIKRHYV